MVAALGCVVGALAALTYFPGHRKNWSLWLSPWRADLPR